MTSNTTITSTSNTLKKLWLQSSLYSYYIQTKYYGKEEIINNIFSAYVEPLLNDIKHPVFIQAWRLNIDAELYENQIDDNVYKTSVFKILVAMIANITVQTQ